MVELSLAEGCIMKMNMHNKIKGHQHRHAHGHGHDWKHHGDVAYGVLTGHPSGVVGGSEFVVILHGRHHHHHHHYHHGGMTESAPYHGGDEQQQGHHHSRRGQYGPCGHQAAREGLLLNKTPAATRTMSHFQKCV
uniref:Uncharacterized protein n=1 Tax=Kalanchoe fedtschenkoi TaxID=63787 RepID=A0A7N0UJK7_KALFE